MPRGLATAIVVVSALLAAEVARLTVAGAYFESKPQLAGRLAPRSPDVLASQSMAQVGEAAAKGETPPSSAIDRLRQLTRVAPLRAEPFLVHGAIAQRSGDIDRAEQLLVQARQRDPRSAAARYLLADAWIRQDRLIDGLGEMASLTRLMPQSSVQLVPALADYAQTPGAEEQLKHILRLNPRLKTPLLNALAADPANLDLILELDASVQSPAEGRSQQWQARLLNSLIQQRAYERAYALWQQLSGVRGPRPLLFNGEFRNISAPPPFNWTFTSGRAGFAEPNNGSLRVLHYGRENATIASQLLLLPPGTYRLSTTVSGTAASGALAWVLTCGPRSNPLMTLDVTSQAPMQRQFEVPAGSCRAQTLELRGRVLDTPRESDIQLGPLVLERGRP